MASPILLLGSSGMLGRAFRELFTGGHRHVETAGRDVCDLGKPETIANLHVPKRGVVINCAAWTDVDGAEANEGAATTVNGVSVGALARACKAADALLVHFSTDYLFDGLRVFPYKVDQAMAPLNAYGRSKAYGEIAIEWSGCRALIVRTSWLYAPWGKNFVRTIHKLLHERPAIKVVNDQRGRPTSAEHLARTTMGLVIAAARACSTSPMAASARGSTLPRRSASTAEQPPRVEPCTSAEFPRPATRPSYSVLDLTRTEQVFGPMPSWTDNLVRTLERLEQ
jgi:dTDP-4-dehydrorhamnose reductase